MTAANEQDRQQVDQRAEAVQDETGEAVDIASVDQGDTGEQPAQDARDHHLELAVVQLPEARQGVVLLPRRWVVERRFAWAARFRRLAREDEQLAKTLASLHVVAFVILMHKRCVERIV